MLSAHSLSHHTSLALTCSALVDVLHAVIECQVFTRLLCVQIAHYHPTPLTPADWAFGIWGVIFLSQAAALWNLARGKKNKVCASRHVCC